MKITASRKDEILRRKAEYDKAKADYAAAEEEASHAYREAEYAVLDPIKSAVEQELSKFDLLQFNVDVRRGDWFGSKRGAKIRVTCNEWNKFEDSVALSWSYDVTLNSDGEPVRESDSWSNLKVTTEEQLASMKQSVEAMEFLYRMDWKSLLDVTLPNYSDYQVKDIKEPEYQDFSSELSEAELEETIGTNKVILVQNWESCPYRGRVYVNIKRETPAMYEVSIIPENYVKNALKGDERSENYKDEIHRYMYDYSTYKVRKSSLKVVEPVDVVEVE